MCHHRGSLCKVRLLNKRREIVSSDKQQEGLANNLLRVNLKDVLTRGGRIKHPEIS
jgi:hypothetical protein